MAQAMTDVARLGNDVEVPRTTMLTIRPAAESARLRALVVMPTYEEAENIEAVLRGVRRAAPEVEVLVVDDSSPDGTAALARSVGSAIGAIHVLGRPAKAGLGSAYRDGIRWGLAEGYEAIVTMDADGSHDPEALGDILGMLSMGADVVLGSRYCDGGRVLNWPVRRRLLSRWGNQYATMVLGLGVRDATAGFRAYRSDWLRSLDLSQSEAEGYCVHVEMTYRCTRAGARIVEVPITFRNRTEGRSKMSGGIVFETFRRVTSWGLRGRRSPAPRAEDGARSVNLLSDTAVSAAR